MDGRAELHEVARDPTLDVVDRSVRVLAILSEALAPLGVVPVLVGGMAVRFWTPADEFVTVDIDLVMDEPPAADEVLIGLGFERAVDQRHWQLPGTEVSVELPSRHLPDGAEITTVRLPDGRSVAVLSQVDVLIVRLEELSIGPHEDLSRQVLALIQGVDRSRAQTRAAQVGVRPLLDRFAALSDDVAAGKRQPPNHAELYDLVRGR